MEDINHQDNEVVTDESSDIDENDSDIEIEYDDDEEEVELNESTLQKLKENDPSITFLSIELNCDDSGNCYFNSVDWKVDGDSISNNTHLESLVLEFSDNSQQYTLGEEGVNLPTKEKLQDVFSCIYWNCSIKDIRLRSIGINDEFGGRWEFN